MEQALKFVVLRSDVVLHYRLVPPPPPGKEPLDDLKEVKILNIRVIQWFLTGGGVPIGSSLLHDAA